MFSNSNIAKFVFVVLLACALLLQVNRSNMIYAQSESDLSGNTFNGLRVVNDDGELICQISSIDGMSVLTLSNPSSNDKISLAIGEHDSSISINRNFDQLARISTASQRNETSILLKSNSNVVQFLTSDDSSRIFVNSPEHLIELDTSKSESKIALHNSNGGVQLVAAGKKTMIDMFGDEVSFDAVGANWSGLSLKKFGEVDNTTLRFVLTDQGLVSSYNNNGEEHNLEMFEKPK